MEKFIMYQNILETLEKYGKIFPEDTDLPKFLEFLNNPENQGEKCVDRKNFNGHVTVSALVVKGEKVLLLWHKTFNKLMQPGGHIDPPDKNILEAIIREVKEETGLDTEIDKVFANGLFSSVPIILAINEIARNDKKKEAAHLHYDIWFLLKMLDESQETKNEDEGVENAGWVDISGINEKGNNVLYKGISKYLEFKD